EVPVDPLVHAVGDENGVSASDEDGARRLAQLAGAVSRPADRAHVDAVRIVNPNVLRLLVEHVDASVGTDVETRNRAELVVRVAFRRADPERFLDSPLGRTAPQPGCGVLDDRDASTVGHRSGPFARRTAAHGDRPAEEGAYRLRLAHTCLRRPGS